MRCPQVPESPVGVVPVGTALWELAGHPLSPQCPFSGVTVTVEPSQEVPEGTKATMSCSATAWGDKGANYTWYRDGRWLREGPSGSLVLGRVSSADAGSYQCQASGTWGTATSVPLSLSVLCECPPASPSTTKPRMRRVSPARVTRVASAFPPLPLPALLLSLWVFF